MSLNCGWCNFGVNAGGLSLVVEHLKQEHGENKLLKLEMYAKSPQEDQSY